MRRLKVRLHDHRGPVGENLRHRAAHFGGIKPDRDDRVRSKALGMLCQSLEGLCADLFEELCVYLDLSATPSSEEGPDVLPQSPGPHD